MKKSMYAWEKQLEVALDKATKLWQAEGLLVFATMLGGSVLMALYYQGFFPLTLGYFYFYSFLLLLLALHRPSWLFALTLAAIPYELVSVISFGFDIRVYQWFGGILALATLWHWYTGLVRIPRLTWFDGGLILVLIGSALPALVSEDPRAVLFGTGIVGSFALLYVLCRVWWRKKYTRQLALLLMGTSALVVVVLSILQSWWFVRGAVAHTVMTGRPNATFGEADWLGIFVVLVWMWLWMYGARQLQRVRGVYQKTSIVFGGILVLGGVYASLLLTVARSAWLGWLVAVAFGFMVVLWREWRGTKGMKEGIWLLMLLVGGVSIGWGAVTFGGLTRFALDERALSVGGQQVITIACVSSQDTLPEEVESVASLADLGCTHIDLEEQDMFRERGYLVTTVKRPDPNVNTRLDLYQQSWQLIREHWFLGVGVDQSARVLGMDDQGHGLNSSNLFLETWLSAGLLGLLGLVGALGWLGWWLLRDTYRSQLHGEGEWLLVLWSAFLVFSLFNATILLALFFVLLGVSGDWVARQVQKKHKNNKHNLR